ncbi:MAG: tetratricopeptide repeat protein [Desulfobulbaceae bacterium]|nr:tetratricopeptide repeat protein [Desulfobulbaceae bacterium]
MKKKKTIKPSWLLNKGKQLDPAESRVVRLFKAGRLAEAEQESVGELHKNAQAAGALYVQAQLAMLRGELLMAGEFLRRTLAAQNDFAEAHFALGNLKSDTGAPTEAVQAYEQALALGLDTAVLHNNLGNALKIRGELERAISHYHRALTLDPSYFLGYFNLGIARRLQGQIEEAANCFRHVLELKPDYYMALDNLGTIYDDLGNFAQALDCYQKSLAINNRNPVAYNNLANAQRNSGLLREAEANCHLALNLAVDFAPAYKNLGVIHLERGEVSEALTFFRRAIAVRPDPNTHSNLLLTMHYPTEISQEEIWAETCRWRDQFEPPRTAAPPYDNTIAPERRLKIGYLSPDFRDHSVAYFIEPVLRAHHREQVDIHIYANVFKADATTARLQGLVEHWREIAHHTDLVVAEMIRADEIDILVDLAGHTQANRLPLFALQPAPVQVTWLGYPNSSGLHAMAYRLTDAVADPPGPAEQWQSESLLRLAPGFLCYQPDPAAPAVAPPPHRESGYITFGSFNNLAKITPEVIQLWAGILAALPGARLLLKSKGLANPETAQRYLGLFEAAGVAADRLELLGMLADKKDHLELYGKIDLALDPFPYNGTTTTCEALWMGVPVVTLQGPRHSGRVGASIMHQIGLEELVAESPEQYRQLALTLAKDSDRLVGLRGGLRQRLSQSPLLDRERFATSLESSYRHIWRRWCVAAATAGD